MSNRRYAYLPAGLACACLALSGCGDGLLGVPSGEAPAIPVTTGGELRVVPQLELEGVNGTASPVVVEELLLHVAEVRLRPLSEAPDVELASAPLWIHFRRGQAVEVRGAAPLVVPAGDYAVSVDLAPASRATRTHGQLYESSVVVRGVCLAYQGGQTDDEQAGGQPSFDPGQWENNPVPMPARPKAVPTGGRVVRIPFSFSSDSSLSVALSSPVHLRHDGGDLAVRLDVARWMEDAIHPIVTEVASAPDHTRGTPVTLDLAEDSADPREAVFRRALETSMAGAFSADAEED